GQKMRYSRFIRTRDFRNNIGKRWKFINKNFPLFSVLLRTNPSSCQPEAGRKSLISQRVIWAAQILPPCTNPSSFSTQILPPASLRLAVNLLYLIRLSEPHKSFLLP